jgi:hypothetical protein
MANAEEIGSRPAKRSRRIYPSTIVFTAVLTIAIILPNLMGEIVLSPERHFAGATIVLESGVSAHLEHGWPLVYLWRKPSGLGKRSWLRNYTLWQVHQSVTRFRPERLAINVAVGLGVLLSGAWLFERWRRRRVRLWQFGLGELAVGVAIAGALLGFFARERLQSARERAALDEIRRANPQVWNWAPLDGYIAVEPAGPLWLRDLLGEAAFRPADAVVALRYATDKELPYADHFPRLIAVSVRGKVSDADLRRLKACPSLEMLNIQDAISRDADGALSVPRLPSLRALFASYSTFRGEGIEHLANLEKLDVRDSPFDDRAAAALPKLGKLTHLLLLNTKITDAALPALRRCSHLELLVLPDAMSEKAADELVESLPKCRVYYRGNERVRKRRA